MVHIPKTVLITGATGDFGYAFAKRFSEAGSRLILHGRSQEKLDKLISSLPKETEYHSFVCDMGYKKAILASLSNIPDSFKNIDLLINNANTPSLWAASGR